MYEKIKDFKDAVWLWWCTFMWAIFHPYCLIFNHQPIMVQYGYGHKNILKCENCGRYMECMDHRFVCGDDPVEL